LYANIDLLIQPQFRAKLHADYFTTLSRFMARNRKRIPLYEVMIKGRKKRSYASTVEKLHPPKEDTEKQTIQTQAKKTPEKVVKWWKKPAIVQFNAGRIEFSLPYPVAIVIVLGIILAVLAAFRFGQFTYLNRQGVTVSTEAPAQPGPQNLTGKENNETIQTTNIAKITEPPGKTQARGAPAPAQGKNVIVLVEYHTRADLVPVQRHFAAYGIETEIITKRGKYYLVTKNRYKGFTPGTDGYTAKQNIIEVGARYKGKAPEGYETFAPHFFKDAYGMKIE